MVTIFYFVTFAAALVMTAVDIFRSKKADTRFVLMGILVTLNCLGRYLVAVSETVEQAIWANKILYCGATFIAPLIIVIVVELCDFRMSKVLRVILLTFAAVIYGCVLTIGHNGLYYASVELGTAEGYHYLIKTYGPAHTLYPLFMLACALSLIYYLIYAICHRNRISFRIVTVVSTLSVSIIAVYILERLFHSTIEWLSAGYLVAMVLMTYLSNRMNMYDMSINISHYVERIRLSGGSERHGYSCGSQDYGFGGRI